MSAMRIDVARPIRASPQRIWSALADIASVPTLAPALRDAQWAQGSTGPDVGAVFAAHLDIPRSITMLRGPVASTLASNADTWTYYRVTVAEPGVAYEFCTISPRGSVVTGWRLAPDPAGTLVTDYTVLPRVFPLSLAWPLIRRLQRPALQRSGQARLDRLETLLGLRPATPPTGTQP